jgi:hypothetical protein
MTMRGRPLPGHRDAERLLDAHGRHGRRSDAHDDLARVLSDAAAPAYAVDPLREHEALTHFRAAVRRPQPARRSVRQRVAALSATAKVVSLAVGATATGGVAIASTAVPLPLAGASRHHATAAPGAARPAEQRPGASATGVPPSPATVGSGVTIEVGDTGEPPGDLPRMRHDRRHGRGVVPGLPGVLPTPPGAGDGTPADTPTGGPTTAPTTTPPTTTAPPTTNPPTSRPPGFEEPDPPPGAEDPGTPAPTDDSSTDHPTPSPTES